MRAAVHLFLKRAARALSGVIRALKMQDSITESKTINYILFMVFC